MGLEFKKSDEKENTDIYLNNLNIGDIFYRKNSPGFFYMKTDFESYCVNLNTGQLISTKNFINVPLTSIKTGITQYVPKKHSETDTLIKENKDSDKIFQNECNESFLKMAHLFWPKIPKYK